MVIQFKQPKGPRQWAKLYKLYLQAFPVSERKPAAMIYKQYRKGASDIWYCTHNGKFVGLAITINGPDAVLLDYLAMHQNCRGGGYGSAVLQALIAHYAPLSVFGEIESTFEDCPDLSIRQRRKKFYLENGMKEMGVLVELFGVTMELITTNKCFTFEEYRRFYHDNYNPWAAEHVKPHREKENTL